MRYSSIIAATIFVVWAQDRDWDTLTNVKIERIDKKDGTNGKAFSSQGGSYLLEFNAFDKSYTFELIPKNLFAAQSISSSITPYRASMMKVRQRDEEKRLNNPNADFLLLGSSSNELAGIFEADGRIFRISDENHHDFDNSVMNENHRAIIIRKMSVEKTKGKKCGAQELFFNKKQLGSTISLVKTQGLSSSNHRPISHNRKGKQTQGLDAETSTCPVNPLQLSVALVADCNYSKSRGGSSKAQRAILTEMNTVSSIFLKNYNIELLVSSVDVLDQCDKENTSSFNVPCSKYPGLDAALNSFSDWRNGRNDQVGIYHLVTSCNYSDTVGLAWMNQVCRTQSFTDSRGDIISGTSMSVAIENHFAIIAHELAHNLGAIHDCSSDVCDGRCTDLVSCQCCECDGCNCKGQFIMDPDNGGTSSLAFSTCTIKDVCDKLPYLGSCLMQQGTGANDLNARCGNGIREGQEECDCGDEASCANNPCCTKDCRLKPGAQCSDSNDMCCQDCQIIPASAKQVCQVSQGPCQKDSICNGKDAICPKIGNAIDGTKCDNNNMCASGLCTSRDTQCAIFGRHLGITKAYPYTSRSCTMICDGTDQAVDMNANFIDGTPCGSKGYCYNGMCSEFGATSDAPKFTGKTIIACNFDFCSIITDLNFNWYAPFL